ncbi:SagB/ThcOx family dehydrogenase [Herbaspirillum sp.]|uniref:SagB/ThcOx family dehydrogenase n=1 Tax=Herbaspirillum sp. TaxID=1890675 RepID=UPI0031E02947
MTYVNPNIFFLFLSEQIVLWDFASHRQYKFSTEYLNRLVSLARGESMDTALNQIDAELQVAGLISDSPYVDCFHSWGWDSLSRIFHVGTKDVPWDCRPETNGKWAEQYVDSCMELLSTEIPLRSSPNGRIIRLPMPDTSIFEEMSLWGALKKRKSCRKFQCATTPLSVVGSILYASFGFIQERAFEINEFVPPFLRYRRTSPSGGGLNTAEAYLVAIDIVGLKRGVYHYDAEMHHLTFVGEIQKERMGELLLGQYFANDLSFGVFLTSRLDRMWWKYKHSRAYRVCLLEIGHLSQTFQLCATAAGMQTWLSGAFQDTAVERFLKLDSSIEQTFLFVGAGYSDGDDLDVERRNILNLRSEGGDDD